MLAIIDKRSSEEAIKNLNKHADDVLLFETEGITYNSISCHPDIFIFQNDDNLIVAPNSPDSLIYFLQKHSVNFTFGKSLIDETLNNSVPYNCITTKDTLFHKKGMTDSIILSQCSHKKFIELPQAYTRCSMICIGNNFFISSDKGIKKVLDRNNLNNFLISPEDIKIIDHDHGFFGGTCGIYNDKIFFNGNIDEHKDGKELRLFISKSGMEIITLHEGPLYDGGGIFLI